MSATEQWKPVKGYDGPYEVSDLGRVRSSFGGRQRILRQKLNRTGRFVVCLPKAGAKKYPQVHQLVLGAFVGPCPRGQECAHNDGNAHNNRLQNLRYDTHLNNMRDKAKHGTNFKPKGEAHHLHKLTEKEVIEIFESPETQMVLARRYQVHQTTISDVKTGRDWSHVTGKEYRRKH